MTEDEAKKKWCPHVRFVIGPQSSTWQERAIDNRAEFDGRPGCLASGCMAWRHVPTADPRGGGLPVPGGYCGLAGKP